MNAEPEHDDALQALLRRSRSSPHIDSARTARVREAVHAAWRDRPARRTARSWWIGVSAAAVAASAVTYVMLDRPAEHQAVPAAMAQASVAGTVRFVAGTVEMQASGSGLAVPLAIGERVLAGTAVLTGTDSRGALALADGVEVRLDRQTRLVVDTDHRLSLERGAIYIDTTRRRGAPDPIEVMALGAVVRDIGTRYEVRLVDEGMRVRVRDGRVRVSRDADAGEASGGNQLLLSKSGMAVTPVPMFGRDWTWVIRATRPPQVSGRSLAEFVAWAQHEGGREIRIGDAAVRQSMATTMVYGAIDGLTVEEALEVVLPSCGLAHRIDGPVINIVVADEPGRSR